MCPDKFQHTMYRTFLLLLLFIVTGVFIQCRTSQAVKNEKEQFKEVYLNQFKLTYFRKILAAGFNQSEEVKALINFDRSGFTEPIITEDDTQLIDSLVRQQNHDLVTDSMNRIGRVAEGAEGKHVLGFILNRIEGKWLDSLANQRYIQSGRKTF
jgi:hypothetical protein